MKKVRERIYQSLEALMFCPACHRRVQAPIRGKINITGTIRVSCACGGGACIVQSKVEEQGVNGPK